MNENSFFKLISVGLWFFLFLMGCSIDPLSHGLSEITPENHHTSETSQPTKIKTTTPAPTRSIMATPTPKIYPTMKPFQLQYYLEKLLADDCVLPCYLGIIPGKSSYKEANAFLEELGASKHRLNPDDETIEKYAYTINFDNLNGFSQYQVNLWVMDDEIHKIYVNQNGFSAPNMYINWYRYSLRESMIQLGIPGEIFINMPNNNESYSVILIYREVGVVITVSGVMRQREICPSFGMENTTAISLVLTDISTSLDLFAFPVTPYNSNNEVWVPIMGRLGINENQFYDQILLNPEACFESISLNQ